MKLSNVKKLVQQVGDCQIVNTEDTQFVGTRRALYAVENALKLTMDNVLAVLDIPADKRDAIDVNERTMNEERFYICLREDKDEPMQEDVRVVYRGREIVILHGTQTGARIGVYADELDAVGKLTALYRRGGCVAVFPDMFCAALILGIEQDQLEAVDNQMRLALAPEVE